LLINLLNPVNALSGVPTKDTVADRHFRVIWHALVVEALSVVTLVHIQPANVLGIPTKSLLRFAESNFGYQIFRILLKIDPKSYSSMAQDIQNGRPTEIDYICGEVVRLAEEVHVAAPINLDISALVKKLEKNGKAWKGRDLAKHLGVKVEISMVDVVVGVGATVVAGGVGWLVGGWGVWLGVGLGLGFAIWIL